MGFKVGDKVENIEVIFDLPIGMQFEVVNVYPEWNTIRVKFENGYEETFFNSRFKLVEPNQRITALEKR